MNFIQKFRNRSREAGYTLIELIVVIAILGIVTVFTTNAVITVTQISSNVANKETGTNQGPVVDQMKDLFRAAEDFKTAHPDCELNRANLEAHDPIRGDNYVPDSITSDLVWSVGQQQRHTANGEWITDPCGSLIRKPLSDPAKAAVCVVAYSTVHQTDKYTATDPAGWDAAGYGNGRFSDGCGSPLDGAL